MEIERKYLISNKSRINKIINTYTKKQIIQDYLYIDNYTIIRKRKIINGLEIIYYYTVKTMKTGISVNEFEKKITEKEYNEFKVNSNYNTIIKDRYVIPYLHNLNIELDIFHGIYEGIIFAEIEFESEKQANEIKIPEWFGMDISSLYTNSNMAINNIRDEIFKKTLME